MIVITGAGGFIGSTLAKHFNSQGREDLVLVDDFTNLMKHEVLNDVKAAWKVQRDSFAAWMQQYYKNVEFIIHLGARTDTLSDDPNVMKTLNTEFSKGVWLICNTYYIPLIYASSAATYGDGSLGYSDDHEKIEMLKPLNLYAQSKQDFDTFVLKTSPPPNWYGLKFFNVYGPGENRKGRMASVIHHAKNQAILSGKVSLFKSYRENIEDGEQLRDFVYVKDVCKVIEWLMKNKPQSGIYNVGTGESRSFIALALSVFEELQIEPHIEFVEMPENLREKYQYFTEADISKLREVGYNEEFYSLEEGIEDYIKNIL